MTDAAELVKLAVAEALWRHETADLRAAKAVRDQMKFCDLAETTQQKWLGFAEAALAAQQDGAKFERLIPSRLAEAFGVSWEQAQKAQDKLGWLYRQRASLEPNSGYEQQRLRDEKETV